MLVKETFVNYTGLVNIGRFAMFINIDKDGVRLNVDDLVKQTVHFPRIVLFNNPFIDKEEVSKLIKKTQKSVPECVFEIHCDGTNTPTGINNIDNVEFIVNLQLKNSQKEYKERINETVLKWFINVNSSFVLTVNNKDDMDEALMLIKNLGISKNKVFLTNNITDDVVDLEFLFRQGKIYGLSIAPDFRTMFWESSKHGNTSE